MNKQQIEQMAEALKWNASALSAALSRGKAIYPGQYLHSVSMGGSKKITEILDMADEAYQAYEACQDAGKESVPSADKIKSIAEQYFIESNPDWQDENQKADTTFGFRMGYKHALLHLHPSGEGEKMAEGEFYPVEYSGYWLIQAGEYYGDDDILDAEDVGEEEAERYAKLIASLLNKHYSQLEAGKAPESAWVSVEDRLPEVGREVLWLMDDGRMYADAREADDPEPTLNCSHWRPLPAPPIQTPNK